MQSVFNELSLPHCPDKESANLAVVDFIKSFIALTKKGVKGFRFYNYLYEIELAPNYTFQEWVDQTTQHTLRTIFVGEIRHPFITPNSSEEATFLTNQYFYQNPDGATVECVGLGTAHIYQAIAVSFGTSEHWRQRQISITEKNVETNNELEVSVTNAYSLGCSDSDEINDAFERQQEVEIIESTIKPVNKTIKLRDDHGKDKLEKFSEKLNKSPYVNGVLNSLPFNPDLNRFIKRVYPNGVIELVLFWEDRGIGVAAQSTGRNMKETELIADKLCEDVDNFK